MDGGAAPSSDLSKPLTEPDFPEADQKNVLTPDLSNPTPASLATAPQDAKKIDPDQSVPDSVRVDPKHPPVNNPFGSTGEKESDVDLKSDKGPNNPGSSDDKK